MSSTPLIGRNGVIQISAGTAVTVGYVQGFSDSMSADLIKEFAINSDKPAILAAGNKHFQFTIDKMYLVKTYQQYVYGGTTVDIIIGPAGSSTGSEKFTYKSCTFTAWSMKVDDKGIVSENVKGEAMDCIVSTF
jgi:hypothetical protein